MTCPHGYTSLFRGCVVVVVLIAFLVVVGFIAMSVPR